MRSTHRALLFLVLATVAYTLATWGTAPGLYDGFGPDRFEFVADHAGLRILRRVPGFEFTPMLLGKITSFIVQPPTRGWAVFAFMFPLLTREGSPTSTDESRLTAAALHVTQLVGW